MVVYALYQEGLEEAVRGNVEYRKSRAAVCGCVDDMEFAAKVWCLRQAFNNFLSNKRNREWFIAVSRQIMCDILRHDKQDTKEFNKVFDEMIQFLNDDRNRDIMREELGMRNVTDLGIWDVLFDFILLDAFDDISSPPSAIVSIFSNRLITRKMKEASLSTVLWTMITAKRKCLKHSDGFMSKFYSMTRILAPPLALAFFGGSSASYRDLCEFFKASPQQIFAFVSEIFSFNTRYTSMEELTTDVHEALRTTVETLQARLSVP
ncbi:hypothetical protein QR680_017612 [Steinernema hermaphroditum]|uniref:Uncharacterized protein n=1 Tax=Steinernema hermaphroditum TaxID=289476 RepID=A0AA39HFV0_9BILA|nr:hypothetical protein QR680_017612 [Steinernema hermaphroditum]